MTKTTFITGVVSLFLLLRFSPSTAEIKTQTITSDTEPIIFFREFGFTHTGHAAITVSSVSVAAPSSQPDLSRMGFFIRRTETLPRILPQDPNFCFLDSHHTRLLFTFSDLPLSNRTYLVTSPSEYAFFFTNCNNKINNDTSSVSVSVTVTTEFFNLNPDDGSRNYLSFDQTHFPSIFFHFSIAYLLFFTFFLYLCHVTKRSLHSIHFLMASLLLARVVTLISAATDTHYVKLTGKSHGWDILVIIFGFVQAVLFLTVVVLVGTQWTFLHPFVRERGKKVLFIVIPLQILSHVAHFVMHEAGPSIKHSFLLHQLIFLPDFYSCCAVLYLIIWSVKSFRARKDAMNVDKFRLMWCYYLVVICYLFVPRLLRLFGPGIIFVYAYPWVAIVVVESVDVVFCMVMFYVFRILEKDEYCLMGNDTYVKV